MAINPLLLNTKDASEMEIGIPTAEGEFFYYEGNKLMKASMTVLYDRLDSAYLSVVSPSSTPPADGAWWAVAGAEGTYTNWSGIVVSAGEMDIDPVTGAANNRVILEVNNGVATKRVERVKGDAGEDATANLPEMVNGTTYTADSSFATDNSIYTVKTGQTFLAGTDLLTNSTKVKRVLTDSLARKDFSFTTGGYYTTSGSTVGAFTASGGYAHAIITVIGGEKTTIKGKGGAGPRLWAYAKADGTILSVAPASVTYAVDTVITAPTDAVSLYLNADVGVSYGAYRPSLLPALLNPPTPNVTTQTLDPLGTTKVPVEKAVADYNKSQIFINSNKALADAIPTIPLKYGWDTAPTSVSNLMVWVCNNTPLEEDSIYDTLTVKAETAGNLLVGRFSADRVLIQQYSKAVVPGINTIALGFEGSKGEYLALQSNGTGVYYIDGGANFYLTLPSATLKPGYIGYYYTANPKFSKLNRLRSAVESGIKTHTSVDWIEIEGQSNALGVGLASGLTTAPFNLQLFDWTKAFSRVFIWNPNTDAFENIKIGVNNMASWDVTVPLVAGATASSFGTEVGLALGWLQTHKTGELYIFKNVIDGAGIAYFQKGTSFYTNYLERKSKAEAWLFNRGKMPNKVGSLWIQGESDKTMSYSNYNGFLTQTFNDKKVDGFITGQTIKVITKVPSGNGYSAVINTAKDDFVSADKYAKSLMYPSLFNTDGVHLNYAGQIKLGLDAFRLIYSTEVMEITDVEGKANWTF